MKKAYLYEDLLGLISAIYQKEVLEQGKPLLQLQEELLNEFNVEPEQLNVILADISNYGSLLNKRHSLVRMLLEDPTSWQVNRTFGPTLIEFQGSSNLDLIHCMGIQIIPNVQTEILVTFLGQFQSAEFEMRRNEIEESTEFCNSIMKGNDMIGLASGAVYESSVDSDFDSGNFTIIYEIAFSSVSMKNLQQFFKGATSTFSDRAKEYRLRVPLPGSLDPTQTLISYLSSEVDAFKELGIHFSKNEWLERLAIIAPEFREEEKQAAVVYLEIA